MVHGSSQRVIVRPVRPVQAAEACRQGQLAVPFLEVIHGRLRHGRRGQLFEGYVYAQNVGLEHGDFGHLGVYDWETHAVSHMRL
jgi:hypothetical protein